MEFRTFVMIILSAAALAEELPNVNLKELPNINLKDLPRDLPRDLPKDLPKDLPNFSAKETWTSTPILEQENPAEGYYAFVQSNAEPPKIKPPPYVDSDKECYEPENRGKGSVSIYNICGDLNKGFIPKNPMKKTFGGKSYPFDLIKNHTLKFFSKTLPILKADKSLPKVPKFGMFSQNLVDSDEKRSRSKRSSDSDSTKETSRNGRKLCENNNGLMCMVYNAIQGQTAAAPAAERRDESIPQTEYRQRTPPQEAPPPPRGPPTPCPAKVEYATPVFAKNYKGDWRYVVQIPYEGYFTQTIEITRCMQTKCHYLDGGCLSSPRWTSLLVAEQYYPDSTLDELHKQVPANRDPVTGSPPPVHDFQNYQQYLQRRAGSDNVGRSSSGSSQHHCDGVDEHGCFQVRLYYDWFLVPGSCKCWRPDYFNRYTRQSSSEL